jgi:hypothetical protein
MKTGPDDLGTTGNESESAKHENGTRRPQYRRKRDQSPLILSKRSTWAQNLKTSPDTLGIAGNDSES